MLHVVRRHGEVGGFMESIIVQTNHLIFDRDFESLVELQSFRRPSRRP